MGKRSAGLLLYRSSPTGVEVFLVHPGGPFWANKDEGAWGLPKGEYADGEDALAAAQREFTEETGFRTYGPFHELGTVKQASGKVVAAWACQGDCDPKLLKSNRCQIEWPPKSRRFVDIPEVDRGAWFTPAEAERYILKSQLQFLAALRTLLSSQPGAPS